MPTPRNQEEWDRIIESVKRMTTDEAQHHRAVYYLRRIAGWMEATWLDMQPFATLTKDQT